MTEGLARRAEAWHGDCGCSINSNPTVGQPPGDIGQHRPVPEQITTAQPRGIAFFCTGRYVEATEAARRATEYKPPFRTCICDACRVSGAPWQSGRGTYRNEARACDGTALSLQSIF